MRGRYIFLLYFSLTCLFSSAQGLIVNKALTWNVLQITSNKRTITYRFFEDTIIKGVSYTNLYSSYSEDYDPQKGILVGSVREDSVRKKVYLRFTNGEVFELYNFKAEICDIINLPSFDGVTLLNYVVEFSDTVFVDSVKKRRMYLSSLEPNLTKDQVWIEGVGSNQGLIETCEHQFGNFNSQLLCCREGVNLHWRGNLGVCYFTTIDEYNKLILKTGKKNSDDNKIAEMEINFDVTNLKLRIISEDGEVVSTRVIKSKKDLTFEKLQEGTYLIEIIDYFDKIYTTRKIKI